MKKVQKRDQESIKKVPVSRVMLPQKVILQIADEVGKRVTHSIMRSRNQEKEQQAVDNPKVLDTSAIIDGRIFELIKMGIFYGDFVVLEGVLEELKTIADSKDETKRERGRRALSDLDRAKKQKGSKFHIQRSGREEKPVDEQVIFYAKKKRGRILTCDYNLSQKARIEDVVSINLYEMANVLKTTAVPGEEFYVKVIQKGKGEGQGVGYLPDGTMIVIEEGVNELGNTVQVMISRILQTDNGKILFATIKAGK